MPVSRRAVAALASLTLAVPLAFASAASAATSVDDISPGLTRVNLLNLNDFHGRIDGGSVDGVLGRQVACTIQTARKNLGDDTTVLLSAGDSVGASTFASSIAQDEPTIAFLNALGLAASAVGNHEFDQGFGDLTGRVAPLAAWTYLGANVYERGTTTPALPEFEVVTVNGVRVGVIGVVTQQTPAMVTPTGVSGLDFGDPVTAVNRVADRLTDGDEANGEADVLVAEYHEGPGAATSLAGQVAENPVFARIVDDTSPEVDVIFNGHTHLVYTWDGGGRSVSQSGSYGSHVGQLQLGIDPTTRQVVEFKATNVSTNTYGFGSNDTPAQKIAKVDAVCAGDPRYDAASAVVAEAIDSAKVLGAEVVGEVSADITRAYSGGAWVGGRYAATRPDDRLRESTLGNLQASIWRDAMNVPGRPGADIGVQNPGGIRADLLYAPTGEEGPGEVTYAEAAAVSPFANTMVTVDLTGAQVRTMLEQQWQPVGASRLYLQLGLSDNVRWTFDLTRPLGSRVTSILVDGEPVDPTATYRIATNSFLGAGGDNFTVLADGENYADSGLVDTDVFISWLGRQGAVAPSFQKLGVEVVNAPTTLQYGKVTTLTVQGWDLTSLGSPRNTSATLVLKGAGTVTEHVAIEPLHVDGLPTRDGVATVSFKLTGQLLPADRKTRGPSHLELVSAQTGTTVTIPVTIKG